MDSLFPLWPLSKQERPTHPGAEALSKHLIKFFNIAFNRKCRRSQEFTDAVSSALYDRYTEDEIRMAFWVARCSTGEAAWLGERLRGTLLPHVVLRHLGRLNNITGKEAKRWLDDLIARAGEANTAMLKSLFNSLPEDMKDGERALLERCEMRWE